MKRYQATSWAAAGLALLGSTAAWAGDSGSVLTPATSTKDDVIVLDGTLRDFRIDHPDMQNPSRRFGLVKDLVLPELDGDVGAGKPVLNTGIDFTAGMITGVDSFNQWFRDVEGVNKSISYSISLEPLEDQPGVFFYARERQSSNVADRYFFPLDHMDPSLTWNDFQNVSTGRHNFYFTYELRTLFSYKARERREHPEQDLMFRFVGDDDVWVFINGKLAVDIGGVHGQANGEVNLDQQAAALGLEEDGVYELVLFFAERNTTESNFRIETTLKLTTETEPLYD